MTGHSKTGIVVLLACAATARADVITYELSFNFGAVDPVGSAPWATVTIDDGGLTNSATLTIQSNLQDPGEFWTGFFFNLDTSLDLSALSITHTDGQVPMPGTALGAAINVGPPNSYSVAGGFMFDIAIGYENSAGPDRFTETEFSKFDVTYTGVGAMSASSLNVTSGGYPVVGRVQGTGVGNQGSGWITVPAPATPLIATMGLAFAARRRRSSAC